MSVVWRGKVRDAAFRVVYVEPERVLITIKAHGALQGIELTHKEWREIVQATRPVWRSEMTTPEVWGWE